LSDDVVRVTGGAGCIGGHIPSGGEVTEASEYRARSPSARTKILTFGPPLAAFLLANLLWWGVAGTHGNDAFDPYTWRGGDSGQYLQIAHHGSTLMPCPKSRGWPPGSWCGNAAWFPGYPALIWVGDHAGLSDQGAGVLISAAFEFATLLLLWRWVLNARPTVQNFLCIGLAAFFFGQIYYRAVFPISAEVFFLLLAIVLVSRERWLPAGIAGAAASVFYSSGFLLALVMGLWALLGDSGAPLRRRASRALASGGVAASGVALVLALQKAMTGSWTAFFKVQDKYGYQLGTPTTKFIKVIRPLFRRGGLFRDAAHLVDLAPNAQAVVVAAAMVSLVAVCAIRWRRLDSQAWIILTEGILFWLFPMALGGRVRLYRADALLLPIVVLFRYLPIAAQILFLVAAIALAYPMSLLFFRGTLV
jgi:hypothetical protein